MSGSGEERRERARQVQLSLRVGTAERERAVEELQLHYTDGRLTTDELEDRTRRAYGARTAGDLAGVLSDLPALAGRVPDRPSRRPGPGPGVLLVPAAIVLLAAALVAGSGGRAVLPVLVLVVLAALALTAVRRSA